MHRTRACLGQGLSGLKSSKKETASSMRITSFPSPSQAHWPHPISAPRLRLSVRHLWKTGRKNAILSRKKVRQAARPCPMHAGFIADSIVKPRTGCPASSFGIGRGRWKTPESDHPGKETYDCLQEFRRGKTPRLWCLGFFPRSSVGFSPRDVDRLRIQTRTNQPFGKQRP